MPTVEVLQTKLADASMLLDDIVLKKYLYQLKDFEIVPLDPKLKNIRDIRLFKITEMVYQKDEYSTYKFASVFSAMQNLNCGIFILANSDGSKTDFYMGIRSLDNKHTTKSLKDTLRNALIGQFPGVKTEDLLDPDAEQLLSEIESRNIAAVSCVANSKDEDIKANETFIQGLEKLALAMQGQKYTAIVLAHSIPVEQLDQIRKSYETIYTQLSPFANMQLSYGTNTALSISDALSHGTTKGSSYTQNSSITTGTSTSNTHTVSNSTSQTDPVASFGKAAASSALGVISTLNLIAAPFTGGLSLAGGSVLGVAQSALSMVNPKTKTTGTSDSTSYSTSRSKTTGDGYCQNSLTQIQPQMQNES